MPVRPVPMAVADAGPTAAVGAAPTVVAAVVLTVGAAMVAVAVVLTAGADAERMAAAAVAAASSSCSSVAGEMGRCRRQGAEPRQRAALAADERVHHRVVNGASHVLNGVAVRRIRIHPISQ